MLEPENELTKCKLALLATDVCVC